MPAPQATASSATPVPPTATTADPVPTSTRRIHPTGQATAEDYAWVGDSGLTEVYSLTWLRHLSPSAVVERIGGRVLGTYPWQDPWYDLPGLGRHEDGVVVTRISGWTLMLTSLGPEDATIRQLSRGGRLVGLTYNFEADSRFVLADNGAIQVDFDPGYAVSRTGKHPDLLLPDMRKAGLDLSGVYLNPADPAYRYIPSTEAAHALTERVTGVARTAGTRPSRYAARPASMASSCSPA